MATIRLKGRLRGSAAARQIPYDLSPGDVQVTLEIAESLPAPNEASARARAKLAAAGALRHRLESAARGRSRPHEEALIELGTCRPHSPSTADLIDIERGER